MVTVTDVDLKDLVLVIEVHNTATDDVQTEWQKR